MGQCQARPRRLRWPLLLAGGLTAVLLIGPLAGRAAAHATLIGTNPADDELIDRAPAQVELRFDEAVEVIEGGLEVIDPAGGRADRGQVDTNDDRTVLTVPIDGEREGTYTVAWRVVSEDSHNLSGSFVFHVGVETGAAALDDSGETLVDAVGGVGRWAGFAGGFVVVGAGVMAAVSAPATTDPAVRRRLRQIVVVGAVVGAVGVAAALVAQSAQASGRSIIDAVGITPDLALDTRTGVLSVLRLAALLVAVLLAVVRPTARLPLTAAATAGAVSLLCASLSGHAWTASNRAVAVPADAMHLLAVAVWLGGLVGLVATLRLATDNGAIVRWFSGLALVAVGVIAVTGTISGLIQVPSLDALGSTGYGQLLLAKVAGFGLLVAFGFYNREILVPQLEKLLARLGRSLHAEIGVAVAVLAVTAVLINQPPARDQVSGPVEVTVTADDGGATVQAIVDPAEPGPNDIHLYFFDDTGAELVVNAVEINASVADIPARKLTVTPITPSHVSALDASLSSSGLWTLQVTAVTETEPATFTLEVPVR